MHAVAELEGDVIQIIGAGQTVLRDDDMRRDRSVVEKSRDPAAGISAADVDHAGLEGIEDGVAVVDEGLGGPEVNLFSYAEGVVYGGPELVDFGSAVAVVAGARIARADGIEGGFNTLPIAGLNGGEETFDFGRDFDAMLLCEGVGERTA